MRIFFFLILCSYASLSLGAQQGELPSSAGEQRERLERGSYTEEVIYDEYHRPREMIMSREGVLEETLSYSYGEKRIYITTRGRDDEGMEYTWKDTLYLREDGSVRMMEREGSGQDPTLGWDRLSTWISQENDSQIMIYNEQGFPERRTLFNETFLVEEEIYYYNGAGELTNRTLENYLLEERWDISYLPGELVSEKRQYHSDLLVSLTKYSYNEAGQMVESITQGKGQTQSWTGTYDSSDRLSEEKYFNGGLLSRLVKYGDGEGEKTESIYNKGRLSLKIYYRDGEIIDEEKFN